MKVCEECFRNFEPVWREILCPNCAEHKREEAEKRTAFYAAQKGGRKQ